MFEDNPKRQKIVYRLSFLPVALAFIWGVVGFSIFSTAPRTPDVENGQVYGINYKSTERFVTSTQYYLIVGLPLIGLLTFPLMIVVTSPKLGLIRYDDSD